MYFGWYLINNNRLLTIIVNGEPLVKGKIDQSEIKRAKAKLHYFCPFFISEKCFRERIFNLWVKGANKIV